MVTHKLHGNLHYDLHGHDLLDDVPSSFKRRNHSLPEQRSKRPRTDNIAMAMAAMPEELEYYHFEMNVEGKSFEILYKIRMLTLLSSRKQDEQKYHFDDWTASRKRR